MVVGAEAGLAVLGAGEHAAGAVVVRWPSDDPTSPRLSGHEIASHGFDHRRLDELGAAGFRLDLRRTAEILEGITGERPRAFRACTWSITHRTAWAVEILAGEGYTVDSSIFPVRHPDYGVPGAPTSPYRLAIGNCCMVYIEQGQILEK